MTNFNEARRITQAIHYRGPISGLQTEIARQGDVKMTGETTRTFGGRNALRGFQDDFKLLDLLRERDLTIVNIMQNGFSGRGTKGLNATYQKETRKVLEFMLDREVTDEEVSQITSW